MTGLAFMVLRQKNVRNYVLLIFGYLLEVKINLGNTHLSRLWLLVLFKMTDKSAIIFSGESPPKPGDVVITLLYVSKYSITAEQ